MLRVQHFLCFLSVVFCLLGLASAVLNSDYVSSAVKAVVDPTSNPTTTFKLRYFKNDKSFTKGGPLFVYIGGQYSLEKLDPLNVNLLDQIATEFKAKIVVVEHRFYGESSPYLADTDTFTNINKIKIWILPWSLKIFMLWSNRRVLAWLTQRKWSSLCCLNDVNKAPAGSWASSFHVNDFRAISTITNKYDAELIDMFTKEFGCKKSAIIDALQALRDYAPSNQLATIFVKDVPQYPAEVFCSALNTGSTEQQSKVQALRNGLVNAFLNPGVNDAPFKVDFGLTKILENKDLSTGEIKAKIWQYCTQLVGGRCAATQSFTDNFNIPCTSTGLLDFTKDRCKALAGEHALTAYDSNMHYKPQYIADQFGIDYKMTNKLPVLKKAVIAGGNWDPKFRTFTADSVSKYADSFYVFKISSATTGQDLFGPNTCDPESVAEARTQIVDMLECWTKSSPPERCTKKKLLQRCQSLEK
uniref:Uncharacterized protein n=1 Tax=Ditylenchus dipsaci TaxID=166011 RepID=A0A915D136_9BILA